jgi:hypothetical protein
MSLLRQDPFDEIAKQALNYADRIDEMFALAQYGADNKGTPPGMKKLETPEDRAVWMQFSSKLARQEQEGNAPGDMASTAIQHPAVQEGFEGELRD